MNKEKRQERIIKQGGYRPDALPIITKLSEKQIKVLEVEREKEKTYMKKNIAARDKTKKK